MAPPLLLLTLLLASLLPHAEPDGLSERDALVKLQQAVGQRSNLPWNQSQPVCTWRGVTCIDNAVTELRLPGKSLRGPIPRGVLGNLTSLRALSLRSNALTAPLPDDISSLSQLQTLHLGDNGFSGEFPGPILSLANLQFLVIANNNFSGPVPQGLSDLKNLTVLELDRNRFSGQLPDLGLAGLAKFNVSYNLLNGSIPQSLRGQPASAFAGMPLCGGPLGTCPGEGEKRKLSGGAIAGIAIGCAAGVMVILVILFACQLKRGGSRTIAVGDDEIPRSMKVEPESEVAGGAQGRGEKASKKLVFVGKRDAAEFGLEELLRASAEVLGKGKFGTTYKVSIEGGTEVVVKRLKDVVLEEGEFRERVEAIGAMVHDRLLDLMAYYYSKDEKLFIYSYLPMRSLSSLLHDTKGAGVIPLTWSTRLSIALDAARSIEYIHSKGPATCHGNIKSSNILMTDTNHAVVSDHCLIQLAKPASASSKDAAYCAPEAHDIRDATQKADVYSFGVLLLELLTRKEPGNAANNTDLPTWVLSHPRDEWSSEVIDVELMRFRGPEGEIEGLLQVAIDCCARAPRNRPTMSEVVAQIKEIEIEGSEPVEVAIDPSEIDVDSSNSTRVADISS